MAGRYVWITASIVVVVLPVGIGWFCYRSRKFRFFEKYGISGPPPSILNGNYSDLNNNPNRKPWEVMSDWIVKYGGVLGYFRNGPTPTIVVANHDVLKRILIREHADFMDRTAVSSKPPKELAGALTSLKGQNWKRVRTIIAPAFSSRMLKQMSAHVLTCIESLSETLTKSAAGDKVVDLYQMFQRLTVDVIARCAFGLEKDCQNNPEDPFMVNVQALFRGQGSAAFRFMMMFPEVMNLLRPFLKSSGPKRRMAFLSGKLAELIQKRRSGETAAVPDIVQLMIRACANEECFMESGDRCRKVPGESVLSDEELLGNALVFLLAGYETTSNALAFLTYNLAKYSDIQQQVYEEIVQRIGWEKVFDHDVLNDLPYLDMVIAETLRMYPPVISSVTRVAAKDFVLGMTKVPAQVVGIEVPIWFLHHDPCVWDNPEKFDPERFSPDKKVSIPEMSYLPFGAGPRHCIGQR